MNEDRRRLIAETMANPALVEAAIRRAVRQAMELHARLGLPVATWQDGQVVWVDANAVLAASGEGPPPTPPGPAQPPAPTTPGG